MPANLGPANKQLLEGVFSSDRPHGRVGNFCNEISHLSDVIVELVDQLVWVD